jgi:hypothetical protein
MKNKIHRRATRLIALHEETDPKKEETNQQTENLQLLLLLLFIIILKCRYHSLFKVSFQLSLN